MTDRNFSMNNEMIQSISIDPSALLTTSTINALHFPDLTTSGISDSGGGRTIHLNLDGVGMCESMTESFCSVGGQDESIPFNNTNGLQNETATSHSFKSLGKKESISAQKKRRSRKAQYDAAADGVALDKIETVNIDDEQNEADDAWLFRIPGGANKNASTSENIFSWVHKEFKENDIHATKHRLLCKLDDMSHARTIRSISCHSFPANQSSDSVKRSSTEQQVHPGINLNEIKFILHPRISSTDLIENALYLTEFFTLSSNKSRLSTLSLDSIEKDHDHFDLFLYDSLNDESSDDGEQFFDCSNDTNLIQTIAKERRLIEQLTRRCSSLDSLDNYDHARSRSKLVSNVARMSSPLRTVTPLFNGSGNTRPTSPASSSPLRQTITTTNSSANYPNTTVRSRDVSREREREPLDFTDLEVMAKVQLENLRQAERQGPLSKRFGGSSNTLLSTDSRDVSPSSVFGATRNTSPVGNNGYITPRRSYSPSPSAAGRIPIRKNSFVVTESQYTHVLPSVSPRSGSPAIRTGHWSGRLTPSALETCMETSFIASNSPLPHSLLPNNADNPFADSASDQSGNKPPAVPKSLLPRNGVKPNNHRRSNTQTISTNLPNGYDLPDATDLKPSTPTNRPNVTPTTSNRTRPPVSRPLPMYRGSQTTYINTNNNTKVQAPSTLQKNVKKSANDLGSTFTAKQFSSNDNGLLNDVSNKPLTTPTRSQGALQRRTPTQSSIDKHPPPSSSSSIDMTTATLNNAQTTSIPRSSSSLSQGRRSGIPTIGKQQRPSIPTATRTTSTNVIHSSQSSDSMMVTRNIRTPGSVARPQIPDAMSPTSSWNEGCY
ncbi:unnamed protein product [Rotaria magnacalcarata]|uniref:Uncharacterized protein n=1 Tax=Rotaria magnacalcarata TaxID=392030 RepID=A0A818YA62_9BILA|nr:unnamed protein product [Rotaria magnacalcarata]CAF3751683.1 unnamed protein product [Rotaria magnacalcarata]